MIKNAEHRATPSISRYVILQQTYPGAIVEQNAFQALRLAHRGYVLLNGAITMDGTGRELLARPEIRAAYLEGGGGRPPL